LLLAQPEEDIRAADGIEPVEDGSISAIRKRIGIAGNGCPGTADQVRIEFGNEKPGRVRAGGSHNDVGADLNRKDLVGVGHGADETGEVNFSGKSVNRAHVIEFGRKSAGGSCQGHWAGADVLRRSSTIPIRCKWRVVGRDDHRVKAGSGVDLEDISDSRRQVDRRAVLRPAIDAECKGKATGSSDHICVKFCLATFGECEAKREDS